MNKAFDQGKDEVAKLCQYFATNQQSFLAPGVKEAHVRQSLIDPFFEALGWDVRNATMAAPQYREVIPEDSLDVEGQQKAPDYTFRVGTLPKFYVEAKKCGVNINADPAPAYQLRRYGFSAKLSLSILTDFEELGVYDCASRPRPSDKASHARIQYFRFTEYPDRWREIWDVFSREAVWSGTFDQYAASKRKRGTSEVDSEFLKDIEGWRDVLARNLALRNSDLSVEDLNDAVQRIIDRIIFLRMAEDRGLESYGQLLKLCEQQDIYDRFISGLCRKADQKYNSGLFHFQKEPGVSDAPDTLTPRLALDDNALKPILQSLYFEHGSPYHFGVLPVEILGTVYERFLGKVIRLTAGHQAKVEEKPEVRKAGGVYYTPAYIVNYIVLNTIGKQIEGKSPAALAGGKTTPPFRVLDMACGSGSFLLGAYQFLLDHCLMWHQANPSPKHANAVYQNAKGETRLTIAERKRILTTHIYGVDIDRQAVETTKLSLLLKALEGENDATLSRQMTLFHERALPNLSDNIKRGNSLIASDFSILPEDLVRVRAFDWSVQFADAMKTGGFDTIIGNPPYRMLQPHNTKEHELDYLKNHYVAAEFKIEFFHLFLQRGVSLLKKNGYHGHIVPTTLLNNVYAENLRRWLMERCAIQHISVAKGRVFEDADVHTSVVIFKAESNPNFRAEHDVLTTASLSAEFSAAPSGFSRTKQARFSSLPGATWNILLNEDNAPLLQKLQTECIHLEKVARINRGLITGDRAKYFSPRKLTAKHHPILAGADIHRYATNPPSEFVLFERPKTSGGCWDADVHLAHHKIVIRQIGIAPTASIITEPIAVTGNIFTARASSLVEEKFLLALINSKLIAYFWRIMFADFKTSFPQVTIFSLSQVPVWKVDVANPSDLTRHAKLLELVDKMLTLTPKLHGATSEPEKAVLHNAITTTDAEIDRLVYELYCLTEEEIKIVEGER